MIQTNGFLHDTPILSDPNLTLNSILSPSPEMPERPEKPSKGKMAGIQDYSQDFETLIQQFNAIC